MSLYLLDAVGSAEDPLGIRPGFPENVDPPHWVGVYDKESHAYVVQTDEPIPGMEEMEAGADIGFDYSILEPQAPKPGAPEPVAIASPITQEET